MKKAIACLLALPLALAACGAQGADSAQSQPATETEQTTETAQETTAPGLALRASCAAQRTRFIPTPACTA